ncbi:MAG TPA: glycoside hydrolase family 16 protein [Nakamurella sp.]|nr:glycoside hydrolase family 16 protein [Nakamurella sp.]
MNPAADLRPAFSDDFDGPDLDTGVWIPHYLPMWSSRSASAATYTVTGSELRLTIPPEQGLWCPEVHEPLRVSGIQSGVFSGPVGRTIGQQPFRDGAVVRESQPTHWGRTPGYGRIEIRARMEIGPRSMAAVWMVGLEDQPSRSAEICIVEVFGDALVNDPAAGRTAAVGMGRAPVSRPAITEEFDAPRLRSTSAPHTSAPHTGVPAGSTSSLTATSRGPSVRRRPTQCR